MNEFENKISLLSDEVSLISTLDNALEGNDFISVFGDRYLLDFIISHYSDENADYVINGNYQKYVDMSQDFCIFFYPTENELRIVDISAGESMIDKTDLNIYIFSSLRTITNAEKFKLDKFKLYCL